jgi:hypothetical protein
MGPFPPRLRLCAQAPFTEAQSLCPICSLAGATKHLQGAVKAGEADKGQWGPGSCDRPVRQDVIVHVA